MSERVEQLDDIIVVKVGTSTMYRQEDGKELLNREAMGRIGRQVVRFRELGFHVPIVTSGEVSAGMEATGTEVRPTGDEAMPETQRLATVGLRHVLNGWAEALRGLHVGGLLVTQRELDLNAPERVEVLKTTHTNLSHGDVPILNENDGVTHGQLAKDAFGQNDTLAATFVAQMAGSDLFGNNIRLVLLSDIDGVYEDITDSTSVIPEISDLDSYIHLAGETSGDSGIGGMKTKFDAAEIALSAGVEMWIVNGQADNAIQRAFDGEIGTHFTH